MKDKDLRPLLDARADTPALLRDALAAARAGLPSPADLAAVAADLPLARGPGGSGPDHGGEASSPGHEGGAGGASGSPAPAAPATMSVWPGVLVGAALGAVVSGVGLLWPSASEPPRSPSARDAARAVLVTPASPAAAPAPASPLVEATSHARAARPPAPPPSPRAPAAPSASEAAVPPPEPSASAPAGGAPAGGAPAGDVAPEAESEARLLRRAKDALVASPSQALALTDQHAARFPGGDLAQEREVVAIKALVQLGRTGDARARAARFLAAYPGSAHRPGIEALLGL